MSAESYNVSITSSDTSLATPTINKFLLMGKGMLVFILDDEVVEYYKKNLSDKVSSMYVFPIISGKDIKVFLKALEEIIKYTIFVNQGMVDSVMVSTQDEDMIEAITKLVEENRTYISSLYKYYPEKETFLINQNVNAGTFVYQQDENNYVYVEISTSKSSTHIPFIVDSEIPEIDTSIEAVKYDWSYLIPTDDGSGGEGGDSEGGGESSEPAEPIIPLVEIPEEITPETLAEAFKDYLQYGWFFELPLVEMSPQMIKVPYVDEDGDTIYSYFYCGGYYGGWTPPMPESGGGDEGGSSEPQLPSIYIIRTNVNHNLKLKQTYSKTPTGGLSGMFFDLTIGIGKKYAVANVGYTLVSYNKAIMEAGETEDDNYPS